MDRPEDIANQFNEYNDLGDKLAKDIINPQYKPTMQNNHPFIWFLKISVYDIIGGLTYTGRGIDNINSEVLKCLKEYMLVNLEKYQ